MRASGFQPLAAACSGVVRMRADAPSFSLDELAAVTVPRRRNRGAAALSSSAIEPQRHGRRTPKQTVPPFFWKAGRSEGTLSSLRFLYSSSSEISISGLPRAPGTLTGTISALNQPFCRVVPKCASTSASHCKDTHARRPQLPPVS